MVTLLIFLSIAARLLTSQQAQAFRRRFRDVESLPPFLLPQHHQRPFFNPLLLSLSPFLLPQQQYQIPRPIPQLKCSLRKHKADRKPRTPFTSKQLAKLEKMYLEKKT